VLAALVAYPVTIILHFALAAWGMYRFLRAGGRDWPEALLGAVAFELSGFLIAHRVHLTMLEAVAWLPWMLYAWRRLAQTGKGKHFALASALVGGQMLVQHTQISILSLMLLTAFAAVVLLPARPIADLEVPARYRPGNGHGSGSDAAHALPARGKRARGGQLQHVCRKLLGAHVRADAVVPYGLRKPHTGLLGPHLVGAVPLLRAVCVRVDRGVRAGGGVLQPDRPAFVRNGAP